VRLSGGVQREDSRGSARVPTIEPTTVMPFRWRSTQLTHALSRPPTHHLQNGGLLASRIVCHLRSQASRSAYSTKQFGKCSSEKRSKIAGSFAFACATNASGGSMYASSRQ